MAKETITSKAWFPAVAATVVLGALAIGAYLWIHFTPPVHAGQVLSIDVYPIHRELSTGPMNGSRTDGLQGQPDIYDQLIVLANVRVKNQTDIPLFLHDMSGVVHLRDGNEEPGLAASARDFNNVFIAYPDLKPLRKDPLRRDLTLAPGQQVEGQVMYNFPISKAQWDSRSDVEMSFSFLHQRPLVLTVSPNSASK
jgi:hypothetical protein